MIHSVLYSCSQISGSCAQLEQQGHASGGCECVLGEDKLKLDTVTANHEAFPLITRLKVRETVTTADTHKEKSGGTQNIDKAQR